MMIWQIEWRALSASIVSLVEAAHFLVASAQARSDDPYQARRVLVLQAQEIFGLIDAFRRKYSDQLPRIARQRLDAFYNSSNSHPPELARPARKGTPGFCSAMS
jgi:hypothetical protein